MFTPACSATSPILTRCTVDPYLGTDCKALPAVEQDGPGLDADGLELPVLRPVVLREQRVHRFFRGRLDDVQDVDAAFERAAEQDEAHLDEPIHEPRVLIPAVLLAHVARPVPG